MSDFETPCLCHAREALKHEPIEYRWVGVQEADATLWGTWPECPGHSGQHFKSAVWAQRIGRLHEKSTADETVLVEIKD